MAELFLQNSLGCYDNKTKRACQKITRNTYVLDGGFVGREERGTEKEERYTQPSIRGVAFALHEKHIFGVPSQACTFRN